MTCHPDNISHFPRSRCAARLHFRRVFASLRMLAAILLLAVRLPAQPAGDSLNFKIGQMIMRGFRGLSAGEGSEILRDISRHHLGGVILFDYDVAEKSAVRNIASARQVQALTKTLQAAAATPLFIAIDQEGGKVSRLKQKYGFPASVSEQYLGALDNTDSTRSCAEQTASLLDSLGINLNFAPDVDVNLNPANPVIGRLERSFSANTATVARHAAAMVDGFHAHHVLSALKHFPGHGSSHADSHLGFVDVTPYWSRSELEPFAILIQLGKCDMVMTAHIVNAQLDDRYPATLSNKIITGILRDSLGFDGVVISDDLQMKAITSVYGLEAAIELALNAGVDMLLFGNNTGTYDEDIALKAIAIIRSLAQSGRIAPARIDESFRRIMRLKRTLTD